jgi:hypothetical protein
MILHKKTMLSCPILYKTSFFIIKVSTLLANLYVIMWKTNWHVWFVLRLLWVLWY